MCFDISDDALIYWLEHTCGVRWRKFQTNGLKVRHALMSIAVVYEKDDFSVLMCKLAVKPSYVLLEQRLADRLFQIAFIFDKEGFHCPETSWLSGLFYYRKRKLLSSTNYLKMPESDPAEF